MAASSSPATIFPQISKRLFSTLMSLLELLIIKSLNQFVCGHIWVLKFFLFWCLICAIFYTSKSIGSELGAGVKKEVESEISTWQNAKVAKINKQFKREDAVINGWESDYKCHLGRWFVWKLVFITPFWLQMPYGNESRSLFSETSNYTKFLREEKNLVPKVQIGQTFKPTRKSLLRIPIHKQLPTRVPYAAEAPTEQVL